MTLERSLPVQQESIVAEGDFSQVLRPYVGLDTSDQHRRAHQGAGKGLGLQ